MATRHYLISAVPHDGFGHYFRAGLRWTQEPVLVTVTDEPKPALAHPVVLTHAQLAQLKADRRVRLDPADAPARPEPAAPAKPEGGSK
jgi:hypothetical protein